MPLRRLTIAIAVAALLLSMPAVVLGHVELASTEPAAGAALDDPPTVVTLSFDGELEPDGSGFVVTDAGGSEVASGEVDLEVANRNVLSGDVSLPGDGAYTVAWTAVSADGHAESGSFSFRVGAVVPAPDTAMPRTVPAWPLGLALIAAALLVASRPVIRRWAEAR